jgi:hypothetical protein
MVDTDGQVINTNSKEGECSSEKVDIMKDNEQEIIQSSSQSEQIQDEWLNQKKQELNILYDEHINKLKEAMDLFPHPPGRLMRAWLWFQKHAFTSVIFVVIGISLGIGIEKISNHNEMIKAVNLQRYEFKGDIFEISPSSIKKYYVDKEKNLTSIVIPKTKTEETIK